MSADEPYKAFAGLSLQGVQELHAAVSSMQVSCLFKTQHHVNPCCHLQWVAICCYPCQKLLSSRQHIACASWLFSTIVVQSPAFAHASNANCINLTTCSFSSLTSKAQPASSCAFQSVQCKFCILQLTCELSAHLSALVSTNTQICTEHCRQG